MNSFYPFNQFITQNGKATAVLRGSLILLFFVIGISINSAFAITATQNGNWSNAATWGGSVPSGGNDIVIPAGITVNVNISTPVVNDINVSGNLVILANVSSNLYYNGNLTVSGTLTNNGRIELTVSNKAFTLTGTYIHNPFANTFIDEYIFSRSNESFSVSSHVIIQKWSDLSVPLGNTTRVQTSNFGNVTLSVNDTVGWEQNGYFMTSSNTQRVFGTFTVTDGIVSMDNGTGGTSFLQMQNVVINGTGSMIFNSGANRPLSFICTGFSDISTSIYPTIFADECYGLNIWTINGNANFSHYFYGVKGAGNNGGSDLRITVNGNMTIGGSGDNIEFVYRANAPFQLNVAGNTTISGAPGLIRFIEGSNGNLNFTTNNFYISGGFQNILLGGGLYPYTGRATFNVNNDFIVNGISTTLMLESPSNVQPFRLYVGHDFIMNTQSSNLTMARSKGRTTLYTSNNVNLTGGRFIGQQDTASVAVDSIYTGGSFTMNYGGASTDFFRATYGEGSSVIRTNGAFTLTNSNGNTGFGFVGKYGGSGNLNFYAQSYTQSGGRFAGIYGFKTWKPTGNVDYTIPLNNIINNGNCRLIDNRFALNNGIVTANMGILQFNGGNYSAVHTATGNNLTSTFNITGICQITFSSPADTFMFIGHTQTGSVFNTMQLDVSIGSNLNITGNNGATFISSMSSGNEIIDITGELNSSGGSNSFNSFPGSNFANSHTVTLNVNSNMQIFGGTLYLGASSSGAVNATVNGNLNISLGELVVQHSNAPATLNVLGGYNQTGGSFFFHKNAGDFSGAPVVVAINSDDDATGNFSHTGGVMNFDNNPTSVTAILDIYSPNVTFGGTGNITMANAGNNFTLANVNYRRVGVINYTRTGASHLIRHTNQSIYSGCTLRVVSGNMQLSSVNYFTINMMSVLAGGVLDLQTNQLYSNALFPTCGLNVSGRVITSRAQGLYDGTTNAAFNSNGALTYYLFTNSVVEYDGANNQVVTGIGNGTAISGFQKYSVLDINHQGTPNVEFAYASNTPTDPSVFIRNQLVLTNGEFNLDNDHLSASGGRSIVIENGNTDAIVRTGGYIRSEVHDSTASVKWVIGNTTGDHIIPFGYNSTTYIPFNFNLPGNDADTVTVSTYHTAIDNTPYPPGVLHVKGALGFPLAGLDNSANTVDRFWFLRVSGPAPLANLSFVCSAPERGAIPNVRAQCWIDYFPGGWQYPLQGVQSTITNGTYVNSADYFPNNWWTLAGLANPLPITLVDFSGGCDEENIALNWTTASELNNAFFTIKKSTDGKNYEDIGFVNGAGTSTTPIDYKFTDSNVFSDLNYYKLVQTDHDGKSQEYGPIAVESCNELKDLSISVIPNSNSNSPDLLVTSPVDGNFRFTMYSLEGKPVHRFDHYLNEGLNLVELRSHELGAALYIITVENTNYRATTKVPLGIR